LLLYDQISAAIDIPRGESIMGMSDMQLNADLNRVQVEMSLDDIERILRCFKAVEHLVNGNGDGFLDEEDYIIAQRLASLYTILSEVRIGS
jgi:hypothetical protein